MGFVGNLLLFAAVKEFCKSIKVIAMVRVAPVLTQCLSLSCSVSKIYHTPTYGGWMDKGPLQVPYWGIA